MDIVQLRTVIEIYNAGSVSKASLRLNKSQSFISRYLAAFEKTCGGQIFHRNGRGLEPTDLGKRLLPEIESIIVAMERMVGCGAIPDAAPAGEVKVFISHALCNDFVPFLFRAVQKDYPHVRLQFTEGYSEEIVRALDDGDTDVGVFLRNGAHLAPGDEPICKFDTYLVGLKGDQFLNRPEILFSDLAEIPLLLPSKPSMTRTLIGDLAQSRGIPLNIVAEVNTHGCTRSLFDSGAGYITAPIARGSAIKASFISKRLNAGHLQVSRICDPDLERTLVVTGAQNKSETVGFVKKAAVEVLRELADQIQ